MRQEDLTHLRTRIVRRRLNKERAKTELLDNLFETIIIIGTFITIAHAIYKFG